MITTGLINSISQYYSVFFLLGTSNMIMVRPFTTEIVFVCENNRHV